MQKNRLVAVMGNVKPYVVLCRDAMRCVSTIDNKNNLINLKNLNKIEVQDKNKSKIN